MRALEITEQVARVHAGIWAQLAAHGEVIGAHDLWIAATALAHGMGLATGNTRELKRLPGLQLIAPAGAGPNTAAFPAARAKLASRRGGVSRRS